MDRIRRDTLLGLVFFGTLAFLLWATVNLTDVAMGGPPPLSVWFEDGGGAPAGTNVLVLGKKVGKTGETTIDYSRPEFRVNVTLLMKETVPLTDAYRIEIQDAGVLGGKQVWIDPGRGRPLAGDVELRGLAQKGAFEKIGEIADGTGGLGGSLTDTLRSIRSFFDNMNDEGSTVGQLVRRRDLHDALLTAVHNLNQIFETVQEGKGTIGRLIASSDLADKVETIVDNLAATSGALRGTEGTIGMLLNDTAVANDLRGIVADVAAVVADARAGKGPLGRILTDEAMAEDLAGALANLDELLRKANDPTAGALGALTSDPATGRDVAQAIANIRFVTEQLTRTDGALGILLNDRDVGLRLRRIFTQVSRALEDAREAAPIGNFVQVLIGAF